MKSEATFAWHQDSNPGASGGLLPRSRCKHAACLIDGKLYMFGGKDRNIPLKDLWRFDLRTESWECLRWTGDRPPNLQEHTMVPYQNKIYVFGGNFQFGADLAIPFWIFDLDKMTCQKQDSVGPFPVGRRGHSAIVYRATMYVFAGFIDMKRSTNELWSYDFDFGKWSLLKAVGGGPGPSGRYGHSAVIYNNFMWVYGGLSDLQTKDDLWFWDFDLRRWTKVKYAQGPPPLEGHSACVVHNQMLIFGGSNDGVLQNDLWAFAFELGVWTKIACHGTSPNPCAKHVAILASHPDWCNQPSCTDSTSNIRRAFSCPVSSHSGAKQRTRLTSSCRPASKFDKSTFGFEMRTVDVDTETKNSNESIRKAGLVDDASSFGASSADVSGTCLKKQDAVPLIAKTDSSASSLLGVVNPCSTDSSDFHDPLTCQGGEQFGHQNLSFVDTSQDRCDTSTDDSFVCTSRNRTKNSSTLCNTWPSSVANHSTVDAVSLQTQHVLAVNLLGTPTKSPMKSPMKSPTLSDKSPKQGDKESVFDLDETPCVWVELKMLGDGSLRKSLQQKEKSILRDLEADGVQKISRTLFDCEKTERRIEELDSGLSDFSGIGSRTGQGFTKPSPDSHMDRVTATDHKPLQNGVENHDDCPLSSNTLSSSSVTAVQSSQLDQLEAGSNKLISHDSFCPDYCMFVFGGRSASDSANFEQRSISVSRLEIRLNTSDDL